MYKMFIASKNSQRHLYETVGGNSHMKNLTGIWEGEYVDSESSNNDEAIFIHFRLHLEDKGGQITGNCVDVSLSDEESQINGFYEEGVLSFVKEYKRLIIQADDGEYLGINNETHPDIHYLGTFNEQGSVFRGTWEIHNAEEKQNLQEEYKDDYSIGDWHMKKSSEE